MSTRKGGGASGWEGTRRETREAASTPHKPGSRQGGGYSGRTQYTQWVVPENLRPLLKGIYRVKITPILSKTKSLKDKLTLIVEVRNLDNLV